MGDSSSSSSSSSSDPPFEKAYKKLFKIVSGGDEGCVHGEERELPLIDLKELNGGDVPAVRREECMNKIARASHEWGFFQVVNHGIPRHILDAMRREDVKLFKLPFNDKKVRFSPGSYRWGTPSATSLKDLSWSEAFQVQLNDIPGDHHSSTMKQVAMALHELGQRLATILAEKVGQRSTTYFKETCLLTHCYLRMNRYPKCPVPCNTFGLVPHTDSDFLTILHQDDVAGLQLAKDGKWISVTPKPDALVINIGDLFQVWSNGIYRSVEHRVVTNNTRERLSTAFFLCPSYETIIQTPFQPPLYRRFTFGEFKQQTKEDVQRFGRKVGLPRFLVSTRP